MFKRVGGVIQCCGESGSGQTRHKLPAINHHAHPNFEPYIKLLLIRAALALSVKSLFRNMV